MKRRGLLKRNLAFLLTAVMAVGIVSYVPDNASEVRAEGTTTTKTLGTSGIKNPSEPTENGWSGSYVYFGKYNGNAVKYRVLDNETTVFSKEENGIKARTMLLDCDSVLWANSDNSKFRKDYDDVSANDWSISDIKTYLNGSIFLENTDNFSAVEQAAIAASTKKEAYAGDTDNSNNGKDGDGVSYLDWEPLTGEKIFLLDAKEATNESYGYSNSSSRKKTGGNADWWLRSPDTDLGNCAGIVISGGHIHISLVNGVSVGVSPALNIDLSSVLFSSAAEGGKISAEVSSVSGNNTASLSEVGSYTGSEWKLTLKDVSRNEFSVSENDIIGESGDTITLNYKGATTYNKESAPNEYISVILEDSNGNFTHYGRVAQPTKAEDSLQFTLPSGLSVGTYTLHVFSEQYNGDYKTDYASAFANVTLTVPDTLAPTITNTSATRESEPNAMVKFTSSEAGTYYYEVVESGATPSGIDTTGAGTACVQGENTISLTNLSGAGAKDIYIIVKDAAGNKSDPSKVIIPKYVTQSEPVSQDNSNETTSTENQIITETVTPEIIRSPKTGEDGTQILWGLTLIVSLSVCFTLIGAQRKKNNR